MDLRDRLLELVAPIAIGDEVLPGLRLHDVSTEVGLVVHLRGEAGAVDVEVLPRSRPAEHVVHTARFWLAYRHDGPGSSLGEAACAALAPVIRARETAVLDAIASDLADGGRVRTARVSRLLETVDDGPRPFYTLSPYVGCLIGCRFCYAQSRLQPLRELLGLAAAPWGSWVDVRINAPQVLAQELRRLPPRPIKLCPIVSDPYHAVEAKYRVTRRCLDVLAEAGEAFGALVLTRSAAVLEDLDRIAALPGAFVGVSIPTIDDGVRAHFEPRAASIPERLAVLDAFRDAGVSTIAVVQPQLPGPVDALADALAARVGSVSLGVLRGEQNAEALFDVAEYRIARGEAWQDAQALALRDALAVRGIPTWTGELPP